MSIRSLIEVPSTTDSRNRLDAEIAESVCSDELVFHARHWRTRGKKLVVIVGQKKAVAIAVRNVSGRRRWSKLQECLTKNR